MEVLELAASPTLHVGQSSGARAFNFARRYVFVAGATVYLLTVGMRSSRNRAFLHVIANYFGYASPSAALLPEVAAYDLMQDNPDIRLTETAGADGNVSLMELAVLASLVRIERPRALFEIGTFDGRTTVNLAVNAAPAARVFTLDLPPGEGASDTELPIDPDDRRYIRSPASGARFHKSLEAARIKQLLGDSATFDFSPYDKQVDFVFVDGSHSYEYVLSDSLHALEMLRHGRGTIVWHDYGTWVGVTQALNELFLTDPRFKGLRRVAGTALGLLQLR